MSDINQKRNYLVGLYPGPTWKARVAQMADEQVIAIYFRAIEDKQEPKPSPQKESDKSGFHQETLF